MCPWALSGATAFWHPFSQARCYLRTPPSTRKRRAPDFSSPARKHQQWRSPHHHHPQPREPMDVNSALQAVALEAAPHRPWDPSQHSDRAAGIGKEIQCAPCSSSPDGKEFSECCWPRRPSPSPKSGRGSVALLAPGSPLPGSEWQRKGLFSSALAKTPGWCLC